MLLHNRDDLVNFEQVLGIFAIGPYIRMRRFLLPILLLANFLIWSHPLTPRQLIQTPRHDLVKKAQYFEAQEIPDSALKYYVALSAVYSPVLPMPERRLCAEGALKAGDIYYGNAMYVPAFDSFMRAIRMGEENCLHDIVGKAYKNIGNINALFNDNVQAIDCYRKSLELAKKAGDRDTEFRTLVNLSASCAYENRIAEAREYYDALKCYVDSFPEAPYFGWFNHGLINAAQKNLNSALSDYSKAYGFAVRNNMHPQYICAVYSEQAKLFMNVGDTVRAIASWRVCADYAGKEKIYSMLLESLESLGKLYAGADDKGMARKFNSRYLELKDSIITADEYNRIKSQQFVYEMDRNYNDIVRLNGEVEKQDSKLAYQRRVIVIISLALLVFLIMVAGLYWQKRNLLKAYKSIFTRNEELLEADRQNRELRDELERIKPEDDTDNGAMRMQERKKHSVDKFPEEKKEMLLSRILHIMENGGEIFDTDFGIERLAALTESNTRYISFVINDRLSTNFRGMLNKYRIREAQRRLSDADRYGGYTIQSIANSVGYKSYTNFVDIFKKQTGITPSIYQKNARYKDR